MGGSRALAAIKIERDAEETRIKRILYRQRILPSQLERARDRVSQLEREAMSLGLTSIEKLQQARLAGDLIAAEWLRRLGVVTP